LCITPIAAGSRASAGVKGIHDKYASHLHRKGENGMKTFISIFAVTLALAFTVPAFAGDTAAQEQCQKDGGNWDAKTKTCSGKY
jgi:hypothetical protein